MSQPQPSWKMPLILSAVLAVGGSAVYWYQYSQKPKQDKADSQLKKPLALPADETQISMIKVKTRNALIELKCQDLATKKCTATTDGKWVITHPVEMAGDTDNVKDFIKNATTVLATETVDLKDETPEKRKSLLSEYGLSDDKRTDLNTQYVELIAEDGKRYTAWFGVEHPIGDKVFVARSVDGNINDQTIYLISNYYKNTLGKDLTYFRDKTLFTFDRSEIESFDAVTGGGKISGKKVNGMWEVNGYPAEYDRIETAIGSIPKTLAKEFPEPAEYKGAKSIFTYKLKGAKGEYSIEVLSKPERADTVDLGDGHAHDDGHAHGKPGAKMKYFAKVSTRPEVVVVDSILEAQLNKRLNEFRKTSIFTDTEKVTSTQLNVELKGANTNLAYEFKNGTWVSKNPNVKADPKKAQSLLDTLTQLKITQFLKTLPGKAMEELTATIGDDKNPAKFKFRFSKIKDKVYGVDLQSKQAEVYLLNDAILNSALPFNQDAWMMK